MYTSARAKTQCQNGGGVAVKGTCDPCNRHTWMCDTMRQQIQPDITLLRQVSCWSRQKFQGFLLPELSLVPHLSLAVGVSPETFLLLLHKRLNSTGSAHTPSEISPSPLPHTKAESMRTWRFCGALSSHAFSIGSKTARGACLTLNRHNQVDR
jgi:hypothetical protein